MTPRSPRIYTYKITFEEVPYYYYGVHKEKYFNEKYFGSPITNKWCWEFYTPKKQILEFFDYNDKGWIEAQEVEMRLIKPFYNTDKWCLNESCGRALSLEVSRKNGILVRELGLGMFSLSEEKRIEISKKGAEVNKIKGTGIYSLTPEKRTEMGKKAVQTNRKNKTGVFSFTKEDLSKYGSKGGKKTNSQKWECLETGFITNSGCLSRYQKARGIDTSKRKRIA